METNMEDEPVGSVVLPHIPEHLMWVWKELGLPVVTGRFGCACDPVVMMESSKIF